MTQEIKLPNVAFCKVSDVSIIGGHEQLGVRADTKLYTADQVREAIEADRQVQATLYATQYLSLTDAMGYESDSGLSPEEWAEEIRADRQGMGALSRQQIIDRFGFLEGIVSEHNFRRIYETAIEIVAVSDRQARGDPTPPKDAACFDDWVTASDVDGVVYDGQSFERGYQCGKIAELDRLTGHAPEWPDFARMEACLHRLKERLVFENSRRNDLEQKLRKKRNG